jgi:hypothetical protein
VGAYSLGFFLHAPTLSLGGAWCRNLLSGKRVNQDLARKPSLFVDLLSDKT